MAHFATLLLTDAAFVRAPDGSAVRVLLGLASGGMAQFALQPGQVARAVRHRTVEEIWLITEGCGEMWRCSNGQSEMTTLRPGICLTIPLGTAFQFRAAADAPLVAVAVTMPPWPGEDEAIIVEGIWTPNV
jgi:mannose-6-phosphate isomerase-like protein (cupin superfamily)